jgi:hypothetical protein
MKKRERTFEPQFGRLDVDGLAARYLAGEKGRQKEERAFEAGARIRCGDCSREPLTIIYKWKTNGRGKRRLAKNSDEEIEDALRLALSAKTERSAIAVLTGLHGVNVPLASAVLTAIDPERYTVIDVRALESLGIKTANRTVSYYLEYLAYCRQKARVWNISLRKLDRALWQWSKDR